jgi:integrase
VKHPKYPEFTVRIGEFQVGGMLHAFRMVNGRQTSRSLKCRRSDLGSTPKAQETEARRLAIEYIEALADGGAPAVPTGGAGSSPSRKSAGRQLLTISALADKYEVDGLVRVTPGYKRDTLAAIRRIGAFLEPNLLVRDIKPSHLEKYLASRIALHHAVAGRGALVALSICCSWAVGEGLLDTNPLACKRARDAMRIEHTPRRPWYTDDDFAKLKAVAAQLPPAFDVLLDVASGTGRRISAILGLRWADVLFKPEEAWAKCKDLDPQTDWLVEDFANGGIRWYAGRGTNKKRRDHVSPIPTAVKTALLLWQRKSLSIGGSTFVFVAPSDRGQPLERHLAKKWLAKSERLAELPHQAQRGWHGFRRRWATKRKHFPLKDLAAAGDWRDVGTPLKNYQQSDRAARLAVINA